MFDLDDDPTQNNVTYFLVEDFLRLSLWSGGLDFVFFLDNSEILTTIRGRRQIAEPRKYCLVRMIIFLWRVFFLFCFSQIWKFRADFL